MTFVLVQEPVSKYIKQIRANRKAQNQSVIPVEVVPILEKSIPTTTTVAGVINSERYVAVKPEVRGKITYLKEPGECSKDELIIQLDDSSQKAALMRSHATYMETKDQYDRAISRRAKKESITDAEINSLKYKMDSNYAEVKRAEAELSKMSLKASFSGIVGIYKNGVSVGAVVMENQELVSISSGDKVVYFSVPEETLKYIKKEDEVFVKSSAFDETVGAKIIAYDSKTDAVHSIQVLAKLVINKSISFPSGFSSKVIINTSNEKYLCIPESAIFSSGRGANKQSYIYAIVTNREGQKQARKLKVKILARGNGLLGIKSEEDTQLKESILVVGNVAGRNIDGRIIEYTENTKKEEEDENNSMKYSLPSLSSLYGYGQKDQANKTEEGDENNV